MATSILLLVLYTHFRFSEAYSSSNDTEPAFVSWISDPNGRGTPSLVIGCMITLGLCVWSAMHLNIPMRNETSFQYTLRYAKWSLIGIFGPELVVWTAWRQYISARALYKELNGQGSSLVEKPGVNPISKKKTSSTSSVSRARRSVWTMTHGFYAGMGGYVIEMDDPTVQDGPAFIPNCSRLTLTARGVLLLAKCGLLPDVSESEILDKSKTDGFAKALACLQAGWMVVQVLARLMQDLPVTLLEVNTLGHVFCAFVIYILWWSKPRWINEPTKLEGDWVRPVCAYLYMSSQVSGWGKQHTGFLRDFFVQPELSALVYFPPESQTSKAFRKASAPFVDTTETLPNARPCAGSSGPFEIAEPVNKIDGVFLPRPLSTFRGKDGVKDVEVAGTQAQVRDPSPIQLERWQLGAKAVRLHPEMKSRFIARQDLTGKKNADAMRLYPEMPSRFKRQNTITMEKTANLDWLECSVEQLVTEHAGNWPADDLLRGMAGLMMGMILWFASVGFGGLHIAAWRGYFPSNVEAWLWRLSSIYISFSGLLWLSINMMAHFSGTIWWYWYDLLSFDSHWINYVIIGLLCSLGGLAYVFARLFLVVEAFISLRSLPTAAYLTPNWTISIPHL